MVKQPGGDPGRLTDPKTSRCAYALEGRKRGKKRLIRIKKPGARFVLPCGGPPTQSIGQMHVAKSHPSRAMADQGWSYLSRACCSSTAPQGEGRVSKRFLCPPLLGTCRRDVSRELELPRLAWEALNENFCHFLVAVRCRVGHPRG